MKKSINILLKCILVLAMSVFVSVSVLADVQPDQTGPDYKTDYYMIVESKSGGVNIYPQPDLDSEKLNEELIPNGTALHIDGEVEDKASGRTWGYTEYHGMNGYVPEDELRPAQSRKEAIDSELYAAGRDNVDYNADYDVHVSSEDGSLSLYQGPGTKYGKVPGVRDIENGEVLHITEDADLLDGGHWGKTSVDDTEGWADLTQTEEWQKEHPSETTEQPTEEAVDMTPVTATPEATAAPTVTVTPEPTATPNPTETPAPTASPEPTTEPEATEEPAVSATPDSKEDTAEEARTVSGEKVKAESSRWYQSPFAWIIGIGVLAAVILLIYHKNKENRDGKR